MRAPCWKQSTGYIPEDLQARHVKYVLNQIKIKIVVICFNLLNSSRKQPNFQKLTIFYKLMIDSSFLLRNFVYEKIIRVINSFIVHLNAACASLEDIIKPTPL